MGKETERAKIRVQRTKEIVQETQKVIEETLIKANKQSVKPDNPA